MIFASLEHFEADTSGACFEWVLCSQNRNILKHICIYCISVFKVLVPEVSMAEQVLN